MPPRYLVRIVVDPEYGDRIKGLDGPVWIVDSPHNRESAVQIWGEAPNRDHLTGVTLFKAVLGDRAAACAGVLNVVDLHHGEYSHDPPYGAVEVIGAEPTSELRAEFAALGLTTIEPTTQGFRAIRAG